MVFHIGISPLDGEIAVYNTEDEAIEYFEVDRVTPSDIDKIEGLFLGVKEQYEENVGNLCVCIDGKYNNDIRLAFVEYATSYNFQNFTIFNTTYALYFHAVLSSTFISKNGDIIWIFWSKQCYVFQHYKNKITFLESYPEYKNNYKLKRPAAVFYHYSSTIKNLKRHYPDYNYYNFPQFDIEVAALNMAKTINSVLMDCLESCCGRRIQVFDNEISLLTISAEQTLPYEKKVKIKEVPKLIKVVEDDTVISEVIIDTTCFIFSIKENGIFYLTNMENEIFFNVECILSTNGLFYVQLSLSTIVKNFDIYFQCNVENYSEAIFTHFKNVLEEYLVLLTFVDFSLDPIKRKSAHQKRCEMLVKQTEHFCKEIKSSFENAGQSFDDTDDFSNKCITLLQQWHDNNNLLHELESYISIYDKEMKWITEFLQTYHSSLDYCNHTVHEYTQLEINHIKSIINIIEMGQKYITKTESSPFLHYISDLEKKLNEIGILQWNTEVDGVTKEITEMEKNMLHISVDTLQNEIEYFFKKITELEEDNFINALEKDSRMKGDISWMHNIQYYQKLLKKAYKNLCTIEEMHCKQNLRLLKFSMDYESLMTWLKHASKMLTETRFSEIKLSTLAYDISKKHPEYVRLTEEAEMLSSMDIIKAETMRTKIIEKWNKINNLITKRRIKFRQSYQPNFESITTKYESLWPNTYIMLINGQYPMSIFDGIKYIIPKPQNVSKEIISVVGIDFGTSTCGAAVNRNNKIQTISLGNTGDRMLPTFVSFEHKKESCGDVVLKGLTRNKAKFTVFDIKAFIGKKFENVLQNSIWPFSIIEEDDKVLVKTQKLDDKIVKTPEEVLAVLLLYIKEKAEEFQGNTLVDAVISVPVLYSQRELISFFDAAKLSGWKSLHILPEPVAAFFTYFNNNLFTDNSNVLIFDLGGGSLDISLLHISDETVQITSSISDSCHGGQDIDLLLFQYFSTLLKNKFDIHIHQNDKKKFQLLKECQKIKHDLSIRKNATLNVRIFDTNKDEILMINLEEFHEMIKDFIRRIQAAINELLGKARVPYNDIIYVLQAGGCCRMPIIKEMLKNKFSNACHLCEAQPDEIISHGAAIYGCYLASMNFKLKND